MRGVIKRTGNKGYGFLTADNGKDYIYFDRDLRCHHVKVGDVVEYSIVNDIKGDRAVHVVKI